MSTEYISHRTAFLFHIHRSIMTPVTAASKTDGVPFVYKISNGTLCYYGSTVRTLAERKKQHNAPSNRCSSRVITQGELPWTMEVVEYVACTTKVELEDREAFYILNNECVNMLVPGAARRAGGKAAYDKQHYQENKDSIKANISQYYQDNKESIKANSKKRYQDNKEEHKAKCKQHYQDNKESIKARRSVKHDCDVCGGRFRLSDKANRS